MEFKDYYKTLEIEPSADAKAIKAAYRKLARKYHPDVSKHENAEDKFQQVSEAYEVLKDPEKRAEYDRLRKYGNAQHEFTPPPGWQPSGSFDGTASAADFSDFFSSIFGAAGGQGFQSQQPFNQRGQDIETELAVFLEDLHSGASKTIRYVLPEHDADGRLVERTKTLNVKIPPGVVDGERIRLKGQGGSGVGSGSHGDLYLKVRLVPHPLFDVEGKNLIITLPVAPWEAALGAKVTVPTLAGKIQLAIPANSQTGQRFRVKGKGLPGKQQAGDLYAVLKVVMPDNNSAKVNEQWQKLADLAGFDPRSQWSKTS